MHYNLLHSEGLQGTHMDALNPFDSKLMTLNQRGGLWTFPANLALCAAYVCPLWCPEIFVQKSNFLFVFFEFKARICCVFLVQIWVQSLYSNDPFLVCNMAIHISQYTVDDLLLWKTARRLHFQTLDFQERKKNGVNTSQVFRRAILLLARSKLEPDTSIKRTSLFIKSIARLYQNPPSLL